MLAVWVVLLGLLALLLALVLLPFRARASGSVHQACARGTLAVEWAWGLVGIELAPEGGRLFLLGRRAWRFGKAEGKPEKGKAKKRREKEPGSALDRLRGGLVHRRALVAMVKRLAGSLRLRLEVRGVIGTGDPADTALLFGALRALQQLPGVELDVRPEWLDEELEVDARASARVWLAHLLVVAVGLLLVRENRAALRHVRATA